MILATAKTLGFVDSNPLSDPRKLTQYTSLPPTYTMPLPITDTIAEIKRTQNENRRLKREREEINEVAKKQRVEIRRLKRLLETAVKMVPPNVRDDKFFVEVDNAIYKEEL